MQASNTDEKDPSRMQESELSTEAEKNYRARLENYLDESLGSNVEKLQNFTKYVPRQSLAKFIAKYEIFKQVLNIQGSIIECGVYMGGGLMAFAQLSAIFEPVNHQRKIVGFDTFAGFVKLSQEDAKDKSDFSYEGGLAMDSYEDIEKCIDLYDSNRFLSHIPKVLLIKGDISETVPKYLEEHPHTVVSLLYLDADVFHPTKAAIEHFVPRMPKGAIVAFDELNIESWPGETLAVLKTLGIKNIRLQRFPYCSDISYTVLK